MILFGTPRFVQNFFRPVTPALSKPIRAALAPMVLALRLAPHFRSCRSLGGIVTGRRDSSTICRRLHSKHWDTFLWYTSLFQHSFKTYLRWERRCLCQPDGHSPGHPVSRKPPFVIVIDPT